MCACSTILMYSFSYILLHGYVRMLLHVHMHILLYTYVHVLLYVYARCPICLCTQSDVREVSFFAFKNVSHSAVKLAFGAGLHKESWIHAVMVNMLGKSLPNSGELLPTNTRHVCRMTTNKHKTRV